MLIQKSVSTRVVNMKLGPFSLTNAIQPIFQSNSFLNQTNWVICQIFPFAWHPERKESVFIIYFCSWFESVNRNPDSICRHQNVFLEWYSILSTRGRHGTPVIDQQVWSFFRRVHVSNRDYCPGW